MDQQDSPQPASPEVADTGLSPRVGVWLVGARGSVATTTVVGALAVRAGAARPVGLTTAGASFDSVGLPSLDDLVFGGHDVSEVPLPKRAEALVDGGVIPASSVRVVSAELAAVEAALRPAPGGDLTQREALARLTADLDAFRTEHGLARLVVVDVASTEPPLASDDPVGELGLDEVEALIEGGEAPLPPSSLYALAAFRAGCSYVSFTPSPGARVQAVAEAAERAGLPWAGSDGKTGETLLKSALGPMFASRALEVRSWASYNMLGGGDGETLSDPAAAASKTASKRSGLEALLGHAVDGPMHIDHVADLGDWKTAMDHVSFEGFLGVRMSLQFTWTGCDSALAAPLVLDLVRLVARAHEVGRTGPQSALGFYFKAPAVPAGEPVEHRLAAQYEALVAWAEGLA